jgi:hypothetical protein
MCRLRRAKPQTVSLPLSGLAILAISNYLVYPLFTGHVLVDKQG